MSQIFFLVQRFILAVAGLFSIFLIVVGCGGAVNQELTLYDDKSFELSATITVPASAVTIAGGKQSVQAQLDELVRQGAERGQQVSIRELQPTSSGDIVYQVSTQGQDSTALQSASLQVHEVEWQGEKAVEFYYVPSAAGYAVSQFTMTLHGGKILESNGRSSGEGTVTWNNQLGAMHAVLLPKSRSPFSALMTAGTGFGLIVLALLLALAVTGFLLVQRQTKAKKMQPAAVTMTNATTCPRCGEKTISGSSFCMNCGNPLEVR